MIQSWAKLQLKLLLYGTADVAAMRHRHRKLAAAAKEHLRVFLALFISFKNLSYVLSPPQMAARVCGNPRELPFGVILLL